MAIGQFHPAGSSLTDDNLPDFGIQPYLVSLTPDQSGQALGIDLTVVHQALPDLLALYEAPLALIRPDQIVAWRGQDEHQAEAVLAQVLGHSTALMR